MDPLVLLRKCAMAGEHVAYDYEHLVFGSYRVHKNTRCAFRPSKAEPFMDIGSIWYMYHEVSREDSKYSFNSATRRGFKYIGVIDRSELLTYIEGGIDKFEKIVPEVLAGHKLPKSEKTGDTPSAPRKRSAEEFHVEAKRRRQDSVEISFKEYAMQARPFNDLASAVRHRGKPLPGFKPVLQLAMDELKEWSKVAGIPKPKPSREKRPFAHDLAKALDHDPKSFPIILVPNNKSAPVNKKNARALLEDGIFSRFERKLLTEEESKAKAQAPKMEERVFVQRNIAGRMWNFEVLDDTSHFSDQDWLRVVAVVTNGEEWEFHGWPFGSVVDLLCTIKGFYFREKDRFVEMPDHVHKWQVSVLDLPPKNLQHRSAQVRDTFWKEVERFMLSARVKNFKETPLDVSNSTNSRRTMKLPVL